MYNDKIIIQKKKTNQLLSILIKYLNIDIHKTHEELLSQLIKIKLNNINDPKLSLKLNKIFEDYKSSVNIYKNMLKEKT